MLASLSHNWHQGSDRDITKNLKFGWSTKGFAIRFTAPELGNQRPVISEDFKRQLQGYGLTTAHILYRMPDHPSFLQTYVWQEYDLCPKFPLLNRFLAFWLEKLEGPLHSVTVAHARLIKPAEIRALDGEFRLN